MEARTCFQSMDNSLPKISDRVKDLKPYDPVSSIEIIKHRPEIDHFKLDWNESTIPPSPRVTETLVKYLQNGARLNWYPDMCYHVLFEKLARYVGCQISQLIVTNGSDDALELICKTYLDATNNVVAPVPTYNHFLQFAQLAGASLKKVTGKNPMVPELKEIADAIDEKTKIVYLANPNNPTGNVYPPSEILQLALDNPDVIVISDEAYYEFSGISCSKIIDKVPNLIITRSFSKCFGLAGLRIGYLVAQDPIINDLRRVFNPKSVNMLAQLAAVAALDDLPYYRNYIREVKRSAALIYDFCKHRGIPCRTTYANFILLQFENAPLIARKLAEVGVHVRDRSSELKGVIRFGLCTEEQTIEILARLDKVLGNHQFQPSVSTL